MSSKVTASATDESDSSAPSWLAVWTRPRAEKVAARALESLSVSVWLPTINSRRRWSDRWKVVELPLFPGYLFAKSSAEAWSKLLRAQGVLTVVKLGKAPAWIRDNQMTELRCAVERVARDGAEPEVECDFVEGDRVEILDGPLARLRGTIRQIRGQRRLLVGIEQIGRAVSVSIETANVAKCGG